MKTRFAAAAAAMLFTSAIVAPASAATITYTLTGNFQGTLDGQGFDVFATFTGVGDTDDYNGSFVPLSSLTADANGVTYTSVNPSFFFNNTGNGIGGLGTTTNGDFIWYTGLGTGYDGTTALSPTSVSFQRIGQAFVTDRGTAIFDAGSNLVVSASLAGVPEPATWALMILGFGAVGGAMRRRQSIAAKVRFA